MKVKSGFTLVEILIVVVILGILAAVVIPQFTDASVSAKESSLKSNLQTVRGQIELYKAQHTGALPGADSGTTFIEALTGTTNVAGSSSGSDYGPYLQQMPTNPFNDLATVGEDGTAGDNGHGWEFSSTAGSFYADDSNTHAGW